jgi:hypothetical protein
MYRVLIVQTLLLHMGAWSAGSATVLYVFKLARVMVLWIALYIMEKVYQESYVQKVYVNGGKPPELVPLVLYAVLIDAFVMSLVLLIVFLVKGKYKRDDNTFIIDGALVKVLAVDYAVCTAVIVAIVSLLSHAAQNASLFRYSHDGLRGVRAVCTMALAVSAVVSAFPMYRIVL